MYLRVDEALVRDERSSAEQTTPPSARLRLGQVTYPPPTSVRIRLRSGGLRRSSAQGRITSFD
jgi:hypothetical protein